MQALNKRISDLEAQAASTDHCVRVYFINRGEDAAEARLKAGISLGYAGKTIAVEFVDSPNALREPHHGNAK